MRRKTRRAAWGFGLAWVLAATTMAAPTLDECVRIALKANPDVKSAAYRLHAARATVKEATSAYYPQVGLAGNWMRTDNPPQAFFMALNQRVASLDKDFNHPDDIENARGSVVGQWRLFDSGRREADRQTAARGAQAAGEALQSVRNDLVFQITKAYYTILQARDFVGVQEESVKSISESLRIASERFTAGNALKTDVLSLEVQLSQAREELIRARHAVQLSVAALNAAVGMDVVALTDVGALADTPDSLNRDVQDDDPGLTIEARPEWKAAQAQVAGAEAMMSRARREYLPVVNAFGSVDWDMEPFHGAEQSYLVGAQVELNVFDGFRTRAGVARAASGLAAAQAQADKARRQLTLDLTESRLAAQEARERLDVAARSVATAEEALRITQERFKQGAATVTDLMAVQLGLTAARTRLVVSQYDNLTAKVNVERAAGRLAERWAGL